MRSRTDDHSHGCGTRKRHPDMYQVDGPVSRGARETARTVLMIVLLALCAIGLFSCVHAILLTLRGRTVLFNGMFEYPAWFLIHFLLAAYLL
jgi:hypothetical protein